MPSFPHLRPALLALALAGAPGLSVPCLAQRPYAPARPPLAAAADTNSALAYYAHGANLLGRDPERAAASFYWAVRLRPGWADAIHGEYVARLRAFGDQPAVVTYLSGEPSILRRPEIAQIDSLGRLAMTLNPLGSLRFGALLTSGVQRRGHWDAGFWDELEGIAHAARGNNERALWAFGNALKLTRTRSAVHAAIAQVRYQMGQLDEARTGFLQARAATLLEDSSAVRMVVLYRSKALLEYSLALVELSRNDTTAARDAFGRALQEDLAYYPAHIRLSGLALAAGDTATALSELDLAVQIHGAEPALRMQYGLLLAGVLRYDEALKEFQKARELDPDYAAPYFVIARMYDGSEMYDEALEQYRAFLAHAARGDEQAEPVRLRMAEIEALRAAQAADAPTESPHP